MRAVYPPLAVDATVTRDSRRPNVATSTAVARASTPAPASTPRSASSKAPSPLPPDSMIVDTTATATPPSVTTTVSTTPEATPASCFGTTAWVATLVNAQLKPSPSPATNDATTNAASGSARPIASAPAPPVDSATDITSHAGTRSRRPETWDAIADPSANPRKATPASAGLNPSIDWSRIIDVK